jgi:ATP-dependent helicase HrpA
VIVAGETGSGKTTQLPKICLELGRGRKALIGHTQPRRIAARTVAERIAEELDTPLGEAVGYKVRFTDQASENTLVKLMTDGILLAEMQQDRLLRQYDTLIIDEAHERSLNIDFLLGYLKQLLPQRPDLKLIITSATIDPQRFSRHFGDAPVVEVSGRTYPVEVRYRPLIEDDPDDDEEGGSVVRDQTQAILDAVDELYTEGDGDVLVFMSGEREIRDTADALAKHAERTRLKLEVLPLYARLSIAEQHRVFQQHASRRVVLATNVAETSLTVPGIKYVVDPGTARISRYSHRTKVQRLPIEPISQASANQRKGRCGRTSDGVCIRLYSEEDFESRPEFTDPEILRTSLASVILQMTALGLGEIADFGFIDPPDKRNIAAGLDLLFELGALSDRHGDRRLTEIGRKLAQLPVDPRLARMVVEADRNGCVQEVMVIAAALSIQDPRERPTEHQQAAAEKHSRFADPTSDFLAFLNLWNYLREQQQALSSSAFRRMCRAEFLNYLRVREWQDIHSQLRQITRTLNIAHSSSPTDAQRIHTSILAGLLSHIGLKEGDRNDYLGARTAKFAVFPGSALFKKPPRWVMAAELVETSRLWARVNARIEPEWAEGLAGHLVKRVYSEPHWEQKQGAVMAYEKVTLYGVPIVASRKVNYGRVDPELSRELFIRHALVEGDWTTHHRFFAANRALLADVEDLEHRARRRDILVDDETLFAFYDKRIPADVVSGQHFDAWWKQARRGDPELLSYTEDLLVAEGARTISGDDYPDTWRQDGLALPLTYQFEPGAAADGVTVHVPVAVLNQVQSAGFDWQIPGLRHELVTALIKSLPKHLRRNFVPAPDFARMVLDRLPESGSEPFAEAVGQVLRTLTGVQVPPDAWDYSRVPGHLRITFQVATPGNARASASKDLDALKPKLKKQTRTAIVEAVPDIERSGLREWPSEPLPAVFERRRGEHVVKAYPGLADEGTSVAIRVFETESEARQATRIATRRLLLLTVPSPAKAAAGRLSNAAKLALTRNPHGSVAALLEDCASCAIDALVDSAGGPPADAAGFAALAATVRERLVPETVAVLGQVEKVLRAAQATESRLRSLTGAAYAPSVADIHAQLAALIHQGFVTETGRARLGDVVRYLQAAQARAEKLEVDAGRDRVRMAAVTEIQREYADKLAQRTRPGRTPSPELLAVRWMIEELRISLFAQPMKTAYPISEQRIFRALDTA